MLLDDEGEERGWERRQKTRETQGEGKGEESALEICAQKIARPPGSDGEQWTALTAIFLVGETS